MIDGLQFISEKEAAQLKPPRLKIHKVKKNETWDSITKKYFKTATGKEKLAEYNGLEASRGPLPGILLKIPPSLRFQ
jgi:predicted Zn-dependent protease